MAASEPAADPPSRADPPEGAFVRFSVSGVMALLSLSVTAFCFVALEILPVGILPLLTRDLAVPTTQGGLLVTGHAVTVVLATMPLTRATRAAPRRALIVVLLVVLVAATLLAAAAANYPMLLAARVTTALSQSVFWAVVGPVAASMFPVRARGRVLSVVFSGAALAPMVGVPFGTMLGQRAGWRAAFVVLAVLAGTALVAVLVALPSVPPGSGGAAPGPAPDRKRFRVAVATTTLVVTGLFTAFTYTAVFLTDVAGASAGALGPILMARGVADFAGIWVGGALSDRNQRVAVLAPTAVLVIAYLAMGTIVVTPAPAAILLAVTGLAMGMVTPALSNRVLEVAPDRTDVASAANSVAYNVGIATGSALGGGVVAVAGVRATAPAAGVVFGLALLLCLAEPALARDPVRPAPAVPGDVPRR